MLSLFGRGKDEKEQSHYNLSQHKTDKSEYLTGYQKYMRKVLFEDLKLQDSDRFKSFIADITINTADLRQIEATTTKVAGGPAPICTPIDVDTLLKDNLFLAFLKKKTNKS